MTGWLTMGRLAKAGMFALALGASGVAHAGVSEDFAGCDGLKKPKGKDDGMRGTAVMTPFSQTGAVQTLTACGRALSSPNLLASQNLRRAHLLRARGVAYFELDQAENALRDFDAAEAAMAGQPQDLFYSRSMGASLLLLRAMAKASLGEPAEAARLAQEGAALRPYALQIQLAAALVLDSTTPLGQAPLATSPALRRLEPASATLSARQAASGDFAAIVARAGGKPESLSASSANARMMLGLDGTGTVLTVFLNASQALAYAFAATGDNDAARQQNAVVCGQLDALGPAPADGAAPCSSAVARMVKPRVQLVEARIAVNEGRLADADAIIASAKLPVGWESYDLLKARAAASPEGIEPGRADDMFAQIRLQRTRALGRASDMLLIAPESARKVIDYEQSRPDIMRALVNGAVTMGVGLLGGIERTAGFRSAANADGTVSVEYTGNTTSGPMVQEMTLLRAAELARAAESERFVIVSRKDYERSMVTSRGGTEVSRYLAGYKTELVVRLGEVPEANRDAAFDTVAVIDALGPLYYEDAGTRLSAK